MTEITSQRFSEIFNSARVQHFWHTFSNALVSVAYIFFLGVDEKVRLYVTQSEMVRVVFQMILLPLRIKRWIREAIIILTILTILSMRVPDNLNNKSPFSYTFSCYYEQYNESTSLYHTYKSNTPLRTHTQTHTNNNISHTAQIMRLRTTFPDVIHAHGYSTRS